MQQSLSHDNYRVPTSQESQEKVRKFDDFVKMSGNLIILLKSQEKVTKFDNFVEKLGNFILKW